MAADVRHTGWLDPLYLAFSVPLLRNVHSTRGLATVLCTVRLFNTLDLVWLSAKDRAAAQVDSGKWASRRRRAEIQSWRRYDERSFSSSSDE